MTAGESLVREFIIDCELLRSPQIFEKIKGGSIGIAQGKRLTQLCNDQRFEHFRTSPCIEMQTEISRLRREINAADNYEEKYQIAYERLALIRYYIMQDFEGWFQ